MLFVHKQNVIKSRTNTIAIVTFIQYYVHGKNITA